MLQLIDGVDFAATLLHWCIAGALGLLTLGSLFLATQAKPEGALAGRQSPAGLAQSWRAASGSSSSRVILGQRCSRLRR